MNKPFAEFPVLGREGLFNFMSSKLRGPKGSRLGLLVVMALEVEKVDLIRNPLNR